MKTEIKGKLSLFFRCWLFSLLFLMLPLSADEPGTAEIRIMIDHSASRIYKEFYLVVGWDEQGFLLPVRNSKYYRLMDDGTSGDAIARDFVFCRTFTIRKSDQDYSFDLYPGYPSNYKQALAFFTFEASDKSAQRTFVYNFPYFPIPGSVLESLLFYGNGISKLPYLLGFAGLFILILALIRIVLEKFQAPDKRRRLLMEIFNKRGLLFLNVYNLDEAIPLYSSFGEILEGSACMVEIGTDHGIGSLKPAMFPDFQSFINDFEDLAVNHQLLFILLDSPDQESILKLSALAENYFTPVILVCPENREKTSLEGNQTIVFSKKTAGLLLYRYELRGSILELELKKKQTRKSRKSEKTG
ncbi:MAG: hypothetical protein PHW04_17595 [Candidatus Wallbacteria bacterium]|nr:hypothetical protein [Candidatus Wallbacteria bacterium]